MLREMYARTRNPELLNRAVGKFMIVPALLDLPDSVAIRLFGLEDNNHLAELHLEYESTGNLPRDYSQYGIFTSDAAVALCGFEQSIYLLESGEVTPVGAEFTGAIKDFVREYGQACLNKFRVQIGPWLKASSSPLRTPGPY